MVFIKAAPPPSIYCLLQKAIVADRILKGRKLKATVIKCRDSKSPVKYPVAKYVGLFHATTKAVGNYYVSTFALRTVGKVSALAHENFLS